MTRVSITADGFDAAFDIASSIEAPRPPSTIRYICPSRPATPLLQTLSRKNVCSILRATPTDAREDIGQWPRADVGFSTSPAVGPLKENENTANTCTAGV